VTDFLKQHFAGRPTKALGRLPGRAAPVDRGGGRLPGHAPQTGVCSREVLKRVLHHDAAAVILAHNQPSVGTDPARADAMLTATLRSTLSLIEVRVLDPPVVAAQRSMSFAERGLL